MLLFAEILDFYNINITKKFFYNFNFKYLYLYNSIMKSTEYHSMYKYITLKDDSVKCNILYKNNEIFLSL